MGTDIPPHTGLEFFLPALTWCSCSSSTPHSMPHSNSHGTPIAEGSCTLLPKENPSSSEHSRLCLLQGGLQRVEQGNRTHLQRRTRKRPVPEDLSLVQHVTESSLFILQHRILFPKKSMRTEEGRLRDPSIIASAFPHKGLQENSHVTQSLSFSTFSDGWVLVICKISRLIFRL